MSKLLRDYLPCDFKKIAVTRHAENDYTVVFETKDGGSGVVDIDFYAETERMEAVREMYKETPETDAFLLAIDEAYGVGDWMDNLVEEEMKNPIIEVEMRISKDLLLEQKALIQGHVLSKDTSEEDKDLFEGILNILDAIDDHIEEL